MTSPPLRRPDDGLTPAVPEDVRRQNFVKAKAFTGIGTRAFRVLAEAMPQSPGAARTALRHGGRSESVPIILLYSHDSGGMIRLRCPVIPGANDMEEHLIAIGQLADSLKGVQQIELESYHSLGESKALHLGRSHIFHSEFVTEENKRFWLDIVKKHTSKNVVIY